MIATRIRAPSSSAPPRLRSDDFPNRAHRLAGGSCSPRGSGIATFSKQTHALDDLRVSPQVSALGYLVAVAISDDLDEGVSEELTRISGLGSGPAPRCRISAE
jgi:hypothetical protein